MKNLLLLTALLALPCSAINAEIADADFTKAIDKYLASDVGQEKLGETMRNYMLKQQAKAQKDAEEKQKAELENQFKNPVKVDPGNSPVKGPATAKVTIVEFSDFECPYCKQGADTMTEVIKNYGDKVRVVFKNLPLSFHKNAEPAARAALAAHKQGKFWEMHDAFFTNQRGLNDAYYAETAKKLGLNVDQFKTDMNSEAIKKQVQDDMAEAKKLGISGTPGFSVNGVMVKGAYPFSHFKEVIDRWLAQ